MQLYSVNNSQPSFGMALRVPKDAKSCQELAKLIGIDKRPSIAKRGLKRLAASQRKNPYDILYKNNKFYIIEGNITHDVIEINKTFHSSGKEKASLTLGKALKYQCKKLYKAIFEPEAFLPKELKEAVKIANDLVAEDARQAAIKKQGEIVEKILSKYSK